ncbi:aldose 1-epimerase [Deminuibacter soli]|uniref:Aldose 1-epimerase n=1 Tax=Deminuibacter soli TaxID=2291815 RepID=A0A3E1NPJ1_9BACT|nr:aldose 1-epimerase [Deminuibacter soli]RFM29859.1 aldose 1-epimerase [Deminuibacter soli]
MSFKVTTLNTGADGVIQLCNPDNSCTAEIYRFGALLNAFSLSKNGNRYNVIDAFTSPQQAQQGITSGFKSARLSPFTCRMQHGEYTFNGQAYKVEKHYMGPHAIHGIIYDAVYDVVRSDAGDDYAAVLLQYEYPGSDKGYPYPYNSTVEWKLEAGNRLTVTVTVTHKNEVAIPFADGWHPYFKLDVPVDQCTLQFDAHTMVEFDDTLVPTGKLLPDERFSQTTSLNGVSLDNCFVLDHSKPGAGCVLGSDALQLRIQPSASYPYLQIYTPPHRNSIAIENLSGVPDAFNNGMGLLHIKKEEQAVFSTAYTIQ